MPKRRFSISRRTRTSWLVARLRSLFRPGADGGKEFKAWAAGLGLVIGFLFLGALGAAINPKKETKEVVQASAISSIPNKAGGSRTDALVQQSSGGTAAAPMNPKESTVAQLQATPTAVPTLKPTATPATPKVITTPAPTPKQAAPRKINNDVLAAYSKEDFTEMMDLYAIHDIDGVKQMVSEGKVVGLRRGAQVYLEDVDVRRGLVKVRPKGSTTTVWIPSQFLNYD